MDKYQTAMRGEIAACGERLVKLHEENASLTVRRETLERALALYEETRPSRSNRHTPLGRAGSQTAFVLDAIRESGTNGLTTSDLYERIDKAGLTVQQTTVRSLLYTRKKDGVLERLPDGRYRFIESSASGFRPPNNEVPATLEAGTSDENREGASLGTAAGAD